jgi:GH15 family glucan-1,4-alpha-glucosidase
VVARCDYDGTWKEAVHQSLIVLKALTYAPTGGIVAAPRRRHCRRRSAASELGLSLLLASRDATLVLLAFINANHLDEAAAWRSWLLRAAAGDPSAMQIMYGVGGERRLSELTLDWLPGYEGSRPVRAGNAASEQFQLDVFGEVLDAMHQGRVHDLGSSPESWSLQRRWLAFLEHAWKEPDRAILGGCAAAPPTSRTPR